MKRLTLVLVLVFIVAACGGGESGEDGSGAGIVSSPDGKAVLTVAAGSLPDGVTVDDLQIDWAEGLSDEPGAPGVGVRLSPDGLVLSEEATLRFELPDSMADHLVVTHVTSDGFALIGGEIESVDGTRFLTANVDHFSTIFIHDMPGLITLIADATPNIVVVEQMQLVTSEVSIEPVLLTLWIPIDDTKSRLYAFDGIRPSPGTRGGVSWGGGVTWDPHYMSAEVTTDDLVVAFAGSSKCKRVNSDKVYVVNVVEVTMNVTAVGAVIDDEQLMRFGRSGFDTGTSGQDDVGDVIPFEPDVGDAVEGMFMATTYVESECVASIDEDTETDPESPPADEDEVVIPFIIGEDPQGDTKTLDHSTLATGEYTDGVDLRYVEQADGPPGKTCFTASMYGALGPGALGLTVIVTAYNRDNEAVDDWEIRVMFDKDGVPQPGEFLDRPQVDGRTRLVTNNDAVVTLERLDDVTISACASTGENLLVETFSVNISDGNLWDDAEGIGAP